MNGLHCRPFAAALVTLGALGAGCASSSSEPSSATRSAASTSSTNLVADPSFEAQTGAGLAWPWQGSGTIETTTAARGSRDVRVQADSGWNPVQQWIAVKPFTHYVASVAVQSSDNLSDAYFSARGASTWQVLNQVSFGAVGSTEYKTLRFEFDTGNDTLALIYAGFWAHAPATWLRIDDVNVREAPSEVTNGSFESSTSAWQISGASSIDTSGAHTGAGALVLSGKSGWTSTNQWIPVTPYTRYRAGAWVKTSDTAIDGWFSVRGGPSFAVLNQAHYGRMPGDYQWLSFEFDSGANASVLLYAGFWGPGVDSTVEIDDVSVAAARPLQGNYDVGNYGFLAAHYDCNETEANARARIDAMVARFHVTDVQFYDWFDTYDTPTDPSGVWADPWGRWRQTCQSTLSVYIDELHRQGARAWAYVQSVGAETLGLDNPPTGPGAPCHNDGTDRIQPLCRGGQHYCMAAPDPSSPHPQWGQGGPCTGAPHEYPTYLDNGAWADHQVAIWAPAVAALGFDGIHWDTLGANADAADVQAAGVVSFLDRAAPQVAANHLMQTMNFVGMSWWDPGASLLRDVAFLYAEAWGPGNEASVFSAMSPNPKLYPGAAAAMQARGSVMPYYPTTAGNEPCDPSTAGFQECVMLARWNASAAQGVRYLLVGDGTNRLVDDYFPDATPISAAAMGTLTR